MLETIWFRLEMRNKYAGMFFFSLIFSLAVVWFTKTFIPLPTGLSSVFLVSLAAAYPFVRYMKREEENESKKRLSEKSLLKRHEREILTYLMFFTGVTLSFIMSYYIYGAASFEAQVDNVKAIQGIGSEITGSAVGFSRIFLNNIAVFAVTFLISLLISAGMIFILVWNASVLGVFVSTISDNALAAHVSLLSYLPHGLIEIGGYVVAGLAASLLAYQLDRKLRRKGYAKGMFTQVVEDVFILVIAGIGLLVLAAVVEIV